MSASPKTILMQPMPPRIARISAGNDDWSGLIQRLVRVSCDGLPRMFLPQTGEFAFTRKRQVDGSLALAGRSPRYGAIAALGVRHLDAAQQRAILGRSAREFVQALVEGLREQTNLGDLALICWAAAELASPGLSTALDLLRRRGAAGCDCCTVEAAWVLSALVSAARHVNVKDMLRQARDRLLCAGSPHSGIFPHWTNRRASPWYRRHVGCFADQVYPIQALARYHGSSPHGAALAMAARCAQQICRLQGSRGQWWWHYDSRTGRVVEGYPVYTVHQDSMAPMALLDLAQAGGPPFHDAIRLGLGWMRSAAEIDRCLIDDEQALIWRKVTRSGGRLARSLRTAATRVHPRLRLRGLDRWLRPTVVDYEDRPYHLGWILDTWLGGS